MQHTNKSESELMARSLLIHVFGSLIVSAFILVISLAACRRFFVLWAIDTMGFNKGVSNTTCGYILFAVVVSWALTSSFAYQYRCRFGRKFVNFGLCFLLIMMGNCYIEPLIVQFSHN